MPFPSFTLVVAVLALGGCATAPLASDEVEGRVVCNVDTMDRVERDARSRHADVHWVNCPRATLRVVR